MTRRTAKPPARFHYLECPKCESCFKVDRDVADVPAHKCWAEEKVKAVTAQTSANVDIGVP